MAITPLSADLNIVFALDDEPNDVGGLTSSEFKAKFDEAGNAIKTYINDTLIPDIGADTDAKISAAELASGNIPIGGTAGQALIKNSGTDHDASWQSITGASEAAPSTLMQRDANGRAKVANPVEAGDIANKKFVVDQADVVPVGTIKDTFVAQNSKWALCNGAPINQATYPQIYALAPHRIIDSWEHISGNAVASGGSINGVKLLNGMMVAYGKMPSASNTYPAVFYKSEMQSSWSSVQVATSIYYDVLDVCYANGYYYALIGYSSNALGVYYCSSLGSAWTLVTGSQFTINNAGNASMQHINGNIIVIYANNDGYLTISMRADTSPAVSWTTVTLGSIVEYATGIFWTGTNWEILGWSSATQLVRYSSTALGTGWTRTTYGIASTTLKRKCTGAIYYAGKYICFGNSGSNPYYPTIIWSSDLTTWNRIVYTSYTSEIYTYAYDILAAVQLGDDIVFATSGMLLQTGSSLSEPTMKISALDISLKTTYPTAASAIAGGWVIAVFNDRLHFLAQASSTSGLHFMHRKTFPTFADSAYKYIRVLP